MKANGRLFKLVTAVTNFVKMFPLGKDCLMVQIQTIENCKPKIFTRVTTNCFEDGSWWESKWIEEQFTEPIKPFLTMNASVVDTRDRASLALKKIAQNWGLPVAQSIKKEVSGSQYLHRIAFVSLMYKDWYLNACQELNYCIITRILSKKIRQSNRCYGLLMDWTNVQNISGQYGKSREITFDIVQSAGKNNYQSQ